MINYDKLTEIMDKLNWSYSHLSNVVRIGHGTVMRMKKREYQPKRSNVIRKVVHVFKLAGFEDADEILKDCPPLTSECERKFNPNLELLQKQVIRQQRGKKIDEAEVSKALKKKKTRGAKMINQRVLDYFGLRADPFSAKIPGVSEMYVNKNLEQVEDAIITAALENRFLLVQGDCGAGKTTLLQRVEKKLRKLRKVKLSIPNVFFIEDINVRSIGDAIIRDFGDKKPKQQILERGDMIKDIALRNYQLKNKMILIIDEAHRLSRPTLRALKRFWEGVSGGSGVSSIMSIILFGQPSIQENLNDPGMAEVAQRLSVIELNTLEDKDNQVDTVREYIEKKLQVVGGDIEILDPTAVDEVVKYAETPLQINNLMRDALVIAFETKEKRITREVIESV